MVGYYAHNHKNYTARIACTHDCTNTSIPRHVCYNHLRPWRVEEKCFVKDWWIGIVILVVGLVWCLLWTFYLCFIMPMVVRVSEEEKKQEDYIHSHEIEINESVVHKCMLATNNENSVYMVVRNP